jgi:hypothetical protein
MARDDYTKAQRDAWMRQRLAQDVARGNVKRTAQVDAFLKGKPMPPNKPVPDVFKKLNKELAGLDKQINKNIHASEGKGKKPSRSQIERAAQQHRVLYASAPSSCFSEASWQDGVLSLTFANKAVGTWDYEGVSLADFMDFAQSGSLGGWFNDNLR